MTKKIKLQVRKELLKKRKKLSSTQISMKSEIILKKLEESKYYQNASKILIYIPIKNEVNTFLLIKKHQNEKNFFLPKTFDKNIKIYQLESLKKLKKGKYGIPEPPESSPQIQAKQLDLIIVPGVGFDYQGHRIGFGKGYYDRLLNEAICPKIALSFDIQLQQSLPTDKHDQKVDVIITETIIIHTN